jgi:hypothetical protein
MRFRNVFRLAGMQRARGSMTDGIIIMSAQVLTLALRS